MTHSDHVYLIKNGIGTGTAWADLGSGTGAFTLALIDILGKKGEIFSVDKDIHSLSIQEDEINNRFPQTTITYLHGDFTTDLLLPPLDGILAANSLHFIEDIVAVLKKLRLYLKPQGRLLVVEYNTSTGNHWVPYPISYQKFEEFAEQAGFESPTFLSSIPSSFLTEIYSAVAINKG